MPLVRKTPKKEDTRHCSYEHHMELVGAERQLPINCFYNKTDGVCKTCKKHQITTRRAQKSTQLFDEMFPDALIQKYKSTLIRCPFKHKPGRVLAEAILLDSLVDVEYYPKNIVPRPVLSRGNHLFYLYSPENYKTMGEILFLPCSHIPFIYVYYEGQEISRDILAFYNRVSVHINLINLETHEISRVH